MLKGAYSVVVFPFWSNRRTVFGKRKREGNELFLPLRGLYISLKGSHFSMLEFDRGLRSLVEQGGKLWIV